MPFQFQDVTTPSGLCYLLVDASDAVGIDDGRELEARLLPGQPHHDGYMLSRVARGTDYSPEVRKFFPTLEDKYSALAVVVTSPIVRAGINIMLRIARAASGKVRMFTSDDEAVAWLTAKHAELARL